MNDQHRVFADKVIELNNATEAAIAAGYSEKSARSKASQLLDREDIKAYVAARRQEISEASLVTSIWIQQRFKDISDRCMQAEPVMKLIDGEWQESGEYQFDSSGAIKATENLGKIAGVYEKDNIQSKSTNVVLSDEQLKSISNKLDDSI